MKQELERRRVCLEAGASHQQGVAKVKRNGKPKSKAGTDFEYDQPTNDKDSGVSVRSFDGRRNQE